MWHVSGKSDLSHIECAYLLLADSSQSDVDARLICQSGSRFRSKIGEDIERDKTTEILHITKAKNKTQCEI